jgi:hypothetical protein
VPRQVGRKLSAPNQNNKKSVGQPPQITDDTPFPAPEQDKKAYQENEIRDVKFLKPLPVGVHITTVTF